MFHPPSVLLFGGLGWTLEEKETAENREMAKEKAKAKDTKEVTKAWDWEEMPLPLLVLKTLQEHWKSQF